ncbi:hypothetical protein AAAB32_09635, partial [Lactobacillus acidophilus]|uniref:hypothetical protein n=1 Tax=Lactobacillus acidophilus TaxID=1579 RepID=UPI0030F20A3F
SFGDTQLISSLTLARGANAAVVATAIRNQIGTGGTVKAYAGGNTVSPLCAANNSSNVVCLVSTSLADEGDNITLAGITFNTSNGSNYLTFG